MNKFSVIFLSVLFTTFFSSNSISYSKLENTTIVIMGTTDVHGNIYPINYFNGKQDNKGLAKVFTKIKEIRKDYNNTLLVDSGDLLQGTPLTNYFGKVETNLPNPMIKAMNIMKYDALGVGNHEYDYGIEYLKKAEKEADFTFLSGNTYYHNKLMTAFEPYIIKNINGIKVGIISFTTPGVAVWSKGFVENKYDFKDIIKSADEWIPRLDKEADIIICIPHTGFEDNTEKNNVQLAENVGKELAEKFPQIDVMFLGHTHTKIDEKFINNVLITQANRYADTLAVAKLELEKASGKWKVLNKSSKLVDVSNAEPDKILLDTLKNEHEKTMEYVNNKVGFTSEKWEANNARIIDTPIVDLINYVQMEHTKSDLSSAALFNTNSDIPKGNITIADIAGLYIYENTLVVIKITGKQLKEYLEHSASYFNKFPSKELINPKVPGYNYDMISGVDYTIDISKPIGQRIINLKYKGKDVKEDMSFSLALNNYRQSGGGGYSMIKDSPVIYNKYESIRDLIIEYIRNKNNIDKSEVFIKNWDIIPQEALMK